MLPPETRHPEVHKLTERLREPTSIGLEACLWSAKQSEQLPGSSVQRQEDRNTRRGRWWAARRVPWVSGQSSWEASRPETWLLWLRGTSSAKTAPLRKHLGKLSPHMTLVISPLSKPQRAETSLPQAPLAHLLPPAST